MHFNLSVLSLLPRVADYQLLLLHVYINHIMYLFASLSSQGEVLLSTVIWHIGLTVIMADVTANFALTSPVLCMDLVLTEGTLLVLVWLQLEGFKLVRVGELLL